MKKKAPTPAPTKAATTIWPDGGIRHPCGHESSFADGCLTRDVFACPACGLRWRMIQDPPTTWWDGSPKPGDRRMVIDPQMDLPSLSPTT